MANVLSGQITIATAGAAQRGPVTAYARAIIVKALADNAGTGYMGNDGENDVTSSNGAPYDPGEGVTLYGAMANLAAWYFDVATNGDGFAWQVVE